MTYLQRAHSAENHLIGYAIVALLAEHFGHGIVAWVAAVLACVALAGVFRFCVLANRAGELNS